MTTHICVYRSNGCDIISIVYIKSIFDDDPENHHKKAIFNYYTYKLNCFAVNSKIVKWENKRKLKSNNINCK